MNESWKPLSEYSNEYEVSNLGRVKSTNRYVPGSRGSVQFKPSVILTPKLTKNGYLRVHIRHKGKNTYPLIHRLVANAFLERTEDKTVINHKDGNKQNNCVDNLEWCTCSENAQHALLYHLTPSGENSPCAKLSYDDVLKIRSEYIKGTHEFGIVALGKKYGVSKSMISLIVRNEKWKY